MRNKTVFNKAQAMGNYLAGAGKVMVTAASESVREAVEVKVEHLRDSKGIKKPSELLKRFKS